MSEVNFKSLQNLHESLLQKQQKVSEENQQSFVKEVRAYIEQAKRGGSNIASTREREQIRANLRYWANYIYSIEKTFPDTELAPSTVANRPILTPTIIVLVIVGVIIAILAGSRLFSSNRPPVIATPATIPSIVTPTIVTPTTIQITESPTPESSGFNVTLLSPSNGDDVTPRIEFNGKYENLEIGWAIHVLIIKDGKYFPIKEYYPVPEKPTNNDWDIETRLVESPEELSKPQNYAFVLAISLDKDASETLLKSSETGIDFKSLPSTVITFKDTNTIIYRKTGYKAIQETRLVYPYFNKGSYDLFTSKPDGSDAIQITDTPDIYEREPSLSTDGRRIVYVHNIHSIHIMDSNGENDQEIINGGQNNLESPQWSPDSLYISYVLGDTSRSPTSYSIYIYDISTEESKRVSGDLVRLDNYRYHSWIPNSKDIVFNEGPGTSGFKLKHIDSIDPPSLFFDTKEEDIQPRIGILENGYLLTYTIVNPDDSSHDIYAVSYTDTQTPMDGTPIRLIPITQRSGGKDHPILEPNSNFIYYVNAGNIYKMEFSIKDGKIIPIPGKIDDGEYYGDLVIETGTITDNPSFDINYMDTFFPIQ